MIVAEAMERRHVDPRGGRLGPVDPVLHRPDPARLGRRLELDLGHMAMVNADSAYENMTEKCDRVGDIARLGLVLGKEQTRVVGEQPSEFIPLLAVDETKISRLQRDD